MSYLYVSYLYKKLDLVILSRIKQSSFFSTSLQMVIIGSVWGMALGIEKLIHLPISSGVLGLFLMLGLLSIKVIQLEWVNVAAKLILSELVLLFIPLMMSVIQYKNLFINQGLQLILTIVFGTAMVMLSSALTFVVGNRLQRHIYRKYHPRADSQYLVKKFE